MRDDERFGFDVFAELLEQNDPAKPARPQEDVERRAAAMGVYQLTEEFASLEPGPEKASVLARINEVWRRARED